MNAVCRVVWVGCTVGWVLGLRTFGGAGVRTQRCRGGGCVWQLKPHAAVHAYVCWCLLLAAFLAGSLNAGFAHSSSSGATTAHGSDAGAGEQEHQMLLCNSI
jgi:hypothetical protein